MEGSVMNYLLCFWEASYGSSVLEMQYAKGYSFTRTDTCELLIHSYFKCLWWIFLREV